MTSTLTGALSADQMRMLRAALNYANGRPRVIGVWERQARDVTPPRVAPTVQEMTRRVLLGHGTPEQEQAVRITLLAYATARRERLDVRDRCHPLDGPDVGRALRYMSAKKKLAPGEDPTGHMVARFDTLFRAVATRDVERIQAASIKYAQGCHHYGGRLSYVRLAADLAVALPDQGPGCRRVTEWWMIHRLDLPDAAHWEASA